MPDAIARLRALLEKVNSDPLGWFAAWQYPERIADAHNALPALLDCAEALSEYLSAINDPERQAALMKARAALARLEEAKRG